MYQALTDACDAVDADAAIRVMILRGAGGKAFVAGTDIRQFRDLSGPDAGVDYERRLDGVIDRLERVTKPTIAQVQGFATVGGCAIVAACDLCICAPDARFGFPIARTLGNCLSAANCARFIDLVGSARLKDLLFTGRLFDAAEAARLGLVTRIVERDALDRVVREDALAIAANAPLTIRASKEMIRRVQEGRRIAPDAVRDLIVMCYDSADFKEGIDAFLAKRPPQWRGH
jgi:enoyl-CoA hydratase/carnithine racemase